MISLLAKPIPLVLLELMFLNNPYNAIVKILISSIFGRVITIVLALGVIVLNTPHPCCQQV